MYRSVWDSTLAYLLGIDSESRFFKAAENGALFENMMVMEMVKRFSVCKGKTDFFFYRTQAGLEVDLIIELGGKQYGVEVKLAKTITRSTAPDSSISAAISSLKKAVSLVCERTSCRSRRTSSLFIEAGCFPD